MSFSAVIMKWKKSADFSWQCKIFYLGICENSTPDAAEETSFIMKQITSKVILGVPCYALRYFYLEPTPAMKDLGRYSEKITVPTTIQHFNFSKINRHLILSTDRIFKAEDSINFWNISILFTFFSRKIPFQLYMYTFLAVVINSGINAPATQVADTSILIIWVM